MTAKAAFDRTNPNTLADLLRSVKLGEIMQAGIPVYRRKFNFNTAAVSANQLSTVHTMPTGDAPAGAILRAAVRAGGVTGELTPQTYGTTPATTQIAVAPNGEIVALAADAITDCDVLYIPEKVKVLELTLPVVASTGVMALPLFATTPGVVLLLEAEALVGTVTGRKRILVPGATNPATPQCRLSVAKTAVNFTVADAITSARVKIGVASDVDVAAFLAAAESIF